MVDDSLLQNIFPSVRLFHSVIKCFDLSRKLVLMYLLYIGNSCVHETFPFPCKAADCRSVFKVFLLDHKIFHLAIQPISDNFEWTLRLKETFFILLKGIINLFINTSNFKLEIIWNSCVSLFKKALHPHVRAVLSHPSQTEL